MATVLSDIATKNTAGARGDLSVALVNGDDSAGTILYATARFASQTFGTGDVLTLVPANLVPLGSVVCPELSTVYASTLGGITGIDIGTTTDPDAYCDGLVPVALTAKHWANCGTIPAQLSGTANAAIRPGGSTLQENISATLAITGGIATVLVFRIAYIVKG